LRLKSFKTYLTRTGCPIKLFNTADLPEPYEIEIEVEIKIEIKITKLKYNKIETRNMIMMRNEMVETYDVAESNNVEES
jgi:hypothetical protein